MKINYQLDENNYIISVCKIPFNVTKPFIEVENLDTVHLAVSQVIDGVFYENKDLFEERSTKRHCKAQLKLQVEALKYELQKTDYKLFKFLEGLLPEAEWLEIKAKRQAYRDEINRLEAELSTLD